MASSWLKYAFLVFNFIFLCAGFAAAVFGAFILVDKPKVNYFAQLGGGAASQSTLNVGAVFLVVSGVTLIIFAIIGCCGAAKESKCWLGVYAGLLVLVVLLEVAALIVAAVYRDQAERELRDWMLGQLETQYDGRGDTDIPFGQALDFVHVEFECCGIDNYTDFRLKAMNWTERLSRTVPLSCCRLVDKRSYHESRLFKVQQRNCTTTPTTDNSYIDKECYDTVKEYLRSQALVIALLAFFTAGVQVLGIICACCLMRNLNEKAT